MQKSFIERMFPHSPGSVSTLPRYEDDYSSPSTRSTISPPRIVLQDSLKSPWSSPERSRNASLSPTPSRYQRNVGSPLIRHDDPFLQVERAAKNLERMFQKLLDAQSEGLSTGGVGMGDADDVSSVGSPTPTPSIATTPLGAAALPNTVPIRQPKERKITLRAARRGLEKSMQEFAALKEQELGLIDQEVATRDTALEEASALGKQKQLLEDEVQKIKSGKGPVGLRSEVQAVDQEIQKLEATLFELRAKQRILRSQLSEFESSRDSELSSYNESLALNMKQVKSFLRRPPVPRNLSAIQDSGMYALKAEIRTLQMAQDQWTSEVETLVQRRTNVENERSALVDGSKLWHSVVQRIRAFEKDLRHQTNELAVQSHFQVGLSSVNGEGSTISVSEKNSISSVLSKLSTLISSLEKDLEEAEAKNWNLLVCAIGAELVAFEQARDLLRQTDGSSATESRSRVEAEQRSQDGSRPFDDNPNDDQPSPNLLERQLEDMLQSDGIRSPGESSNHSLEDTLREFGNALDNGKQISQDEALADFELGPVNGPSTSQLRSLSPPQQGMSPDSGRSANPRPKPPGRTMTSESEDDEPGPEFLLSHS